MSRGIFSSLGRSGWFQLVGTLSGHSFGCWSNVQQLDLRRPPVCCFSVSIRASVQLFQTSVEGFCRRRSLLSRGSTLQRFYSLRSEIDPFSKEDRPLHELSDPLWCADFAFLVDLTHHLNSLNKSLRGKDQMSFICLQSKPNISHVDQVYEDGTDNSNIYFGNGTPPPCSSAHPPPPSNCTVCFNHQYVYAVCSDLLKNVKLMMEGAGQTIDLTKSECPGLLATNENADLGAQNWWVLLLLVLIVMVILVVALKKCPKKMCKKERVKDAAEELPMNTLNQSPQGGED